MSRAFVKEGDGAELDAPLPRPARVQPCYMTVAGVAALHRELEDLHAATTRLDVARDLVHLAATQRAQNRIREIAQILLEAVPVNVAQQQGDCIRFGATVALRETLATITAFKLWGRMKLHRPLGASAGCPR